MTRLTFALGTFALGAHACAQAQVNEQAHQVPKPRKILLARLLPLLDASVRCHMRAVVG
jgi:hypothetical protein